MLSKQMAFTLSRAEEEKEVEDLIKTAISQKEYQVEILNLTDYQQSLINDAGFKLDRTANKNGYLWRINWQ